MHNNFTIFLTSVQTTGCLILKPLKLDVKFYFYPFPPTAFNRYAGIVFLLKIESSPFFLTFLLCLITAKRFKMSSSDFCVHLGSRGTISDVRHLVSNMATTNLAL